MAQPRLIVTYPRSDAFRVTRAGGFTTDPALYEANALGNVFGAHIKELDGGRGQFIGASVNTDVNWRPCRNPRR